MEQPSLTDWREAYDERLRADWGWLTVTGLHWIDEGSHPLGSAADAAIRLNEGAPAHAANLIREGNAVRLEIIEPAAITKNGQPAVSEQLVFDGTQGERYELGEQSFLVVRRGDRVGVRTWDNASRQRQEFNGPDWYPEDPELRAEASFSPWPEPRVIPYLNALGDEKEGTAYGEWCFSLNGQQLSLLSFSDPEQEQFFVFRDATSGDTTYGAGRFLRTGKPVNGRVLIDFNRAYNPPCAFTPHATCPLAPRENQLPLAITAGERNYRP